MSNERMKHTISFFISMGLAIFSNVLVIVTLYLQEAAKLKKPSYLYALLTVCALFLIASLLLAVIKRCSGLMISVLLMFNGLVILSYGILSIFFEKIKLPHTDLSCAKYFWVALALFGVGYGLFLLFWDRRFSDI